MSLTSQRPSISVRVSFVVCYMVVQFKHALGRSLELCVYNALIMVRCRGAHITSQQHDMCSCSVFCSLLITSEVHGAPGWSPDPSVAAEGRGWRCKLRGRSYVCSSSATSPAEAGTQQRN